MVVDLYQTKIIFIIVLLNLHILQNYKFLLMELYTTNLLGFSLQQNRLQSNFEVIDSVLKEMQQQITILNKQHEGIMQSIIQNKHQIQNIGNKTQRHNTILHQHKNWIEQMNSQFGGFDSPPNMNNDDSNQEINVSDKRESRKKGREDTNRRKSADRKINQENTQQQSRKSSQKNGFQEMIISMKERIKALEKNSEQKDQEIEELKKYFTIRRNRDNQLQQRRASILSKEFVNKNSNSKKDIKQSNMMIELKQNQNEDKSQKEQSRKDVETSSVEKSEEDLFMIDKDFDFKVQDKLIVFMKEFEKMKEVFAERNRILDAHMKDNQQKVQNIEKSIDILERSYDMLKYDYERTNTGLTKTRPFNQTHEQRAKRSEQKLNDTRITNKEYYEQKLIELFNEMDFLKGQYFQLQNKLEKQVQDEPEDQKNERKLKFAHKILNSQKQNQQSLRKQLIMQKRDLKKLKQQFEQFTYGINTGTNQIKTILIKPNETKEDWKSLSTKMQRLKTELQSSLRQLQTKIVTSNDTVVGLNQLEVGIQECKLLLKKKVEINDFEKSTKRIEARLNNFIMQIYEKQGQQNEFDAALAKQPWFCLSCDSELKNYTGKVIKTTGNSEKLVGRKVNPQTHMVRRNDNGRLPSVLK